MSESHKAFGDRHALAVFFVLAYALSWWPWIWTIASPETSPSTILPCGPFFAAVIVLAILGRNHLMDFLKGIVRWRIAPRWYAVALLLPLLVTIVAVLVNIGLGAEPLGSFEAPGLYSLLAKFIFVFVLIGLGEEPAWRGFALPRLLVGLSPIMASAVLGILHMFWHLPLLGVEYDMQSVVPWAIGLMGYTIVVTWMYMNSGGSVLLPALMHSAVNTSAFFFQMFNGAELIRLWWLFAILWALAAVAVVLVYGPSLKVQRQAPAV